jgi:hypothetical protein
MTPIVIATVPTISSGLILKFQSFWFDKYKILLSIHTIKISVRDFICNNNTLIYFYLRKNKLIAPVLGRASRSYSNIRGCPSSPITVIVKCFLSFSLTNVCKMSPSFACSIEIWFDRDMPAISTIPNLHRFGVSLDDIILRLSWSSTSYCVLLPSAKKR